MALSSNEEPEEAPIPTKRLRWATQRVKGKSGSRKRGSIINRLHHRGSQNEKKRDSGGGESLGTDLGTVAEEPEETKPSEEEDNDRDKQGPRTGLPLKHYRRNKIRTAKYTPISFVPKNLWYQFHNIANVYFLFLIILAFFSIFGASNPGLNAVPLIVIVFITAVKDAIEDYRRTVLDNELNNSPVHRLVDWNNVNVSTDDISLWRRFKKACTRGIISTWKKFGKNKEVPGKEYAERAMDEPRESFETRATRRASAFSAHSQGASFEAGDEIQMTPVPSPLPRPDGLEVPEHDRPKTAFSYEGESAPASKNFGSLINPDLPVTGKPRFHQDYWKNVQVGDFVRLYNDDQIPADVVILSTSDPDGACYVETKNLDGETNLKVRHALRSGRKIKHAKDCERTEFTIESEPPQANIYQYSAVARWNQHPTGEDMAEPISINNLLLRGCNLRNTDWVLGVVIFTGFDTKIMMNAGITPSKRSRISRELNWNVIYNFIILLVMCLVSGLVQGITWAQGNNSLDFFEFGSIGGSPALDGFITFWAAVILFQNLVPISLYISLEIIKTCQAFFIYSDVDMYYDKLDYPCTPKSWNISDDLGQIEYIFSDKTGTLTQNVMEFKKATVNGVPYGEAYTEAQAGMQKRLGIDVEKEGARVREEIAQARVKMLLDLRKIHDNPYLHDEDLTFIAPDFVSDLAGESGLEQQQANDQFMLALALCHTVISETIPGDPPKIEFKAQSPDEAALVATARDVGYTVLGNSEEGIRLNIQGQDRSYKVLNTLEFNSTRKRMSAIIRMPDNKIILFCKGADSMIYSRLKPGEQPELRKVTAEHLEMFAREGLRTLCIAQKELGEEEYQRWNRDHELASAAITDREEKLEAVSDIIERDLTLLGGTAIEDRLQEGVPDTIALLAEAGIKLWVLTGDKVETAINIGFSCNLLNNDMELIVFKIDDEQVATAEAELEQHLKTFGITGSDEELKAARKSHHAPAPTHAIVIDGESLKLVLDPQLRQRFLLLCKQCKSVLCCRVSPAQKAAVVQMVKNGLDVMTLSIGDGANDVAMIQEADIGVGIAGEEGRQAVMSSDYAIGQFRYLQRLVLVHGRWSYRRVAETIANFFYKNIVWTFTIFWYQIFCDFDMTYLYDYTYILLFNLAFTSLPFIFIGVLDQDVSDKVSLAVPQLYRRGIERKEWTQPKFWLYMLDGLYQSVVCFFVAWLLFRVAGFVTSNGLGLDDRERFGVYVGPAALVVINLYILLNTYRWDWLIVLLVAISVLLVWFWTGVYSAFESSEYFYKAAAETFSQASFWAVTSLSVILSLLPRFAIKFVQKVYFPYDIDIVREQVRQGKFDYLNKVDESDDTVSKESSTTSSDVPKPSKHTYYPSIDEDQRPIYPPSVAATATTHNARSQTGSDGTDFTRHRQSLDQTPLDVPTVRPSFDRARPSFDRMRMSMDRIRPSFEASNDFTSAALLTRLESTQSFGPVRSRRTDVSSDLR
ncbi:P-type ATPase-like protein [Halenospora varia]|nr:P-type ATPase-like protein [Halenospora varia]